nr:pentatricopeptide repeat protein AaPPR152 [Agave angustifolia]
MAPNPPSSSSLSGSNKCPSPSLSPSRIRKLISSQSDPLMAKEIYLLSSSSSSPTNSPTPTLTLILKLARSPKFAHHSLSLLRHLPSPLLSPSLLSSLALTFASLSRPDLTLSLLNRHSSSIPRLLQSSNSSDIKHFNRLLSALSSHPSSLAAALSLLRSSPSPSVRSFNILIAAFSRTNTNCNNLSIAYSLFNAMFALNLRPDADSYRFLMQSLCRKSQLRTALDLLDDMLNKGLLPDAPSYTTILNTLCRKKRLREAYKMLCRMKVKGCNPDIVHYNTVILGFCREGRPLDACKVFEDMSNAGCLPNLVTYTTLVNGLCWQGLLEAANGYLEEMLGKGLTPHFSVFHGLIKGFCGLGKVEEACTALEAMLRLGVSPHLDTWLVVVAGICDDDRDKLDKDLIKVLLNEELCKRGIKIVTRMQVPGNHINNMSRLII